MLQAKPGDIPQHDRQLIMKSIIDFETRVYEKMNIQLINVTPRNVITTGSGSLIFIDFGHAIFNRKSDDLIAKDLNTLLGQWNKIAKAREFNTCGWIDWDWRPWIEAEYAHTVDTITPEIQKRFRHLLN